MGTSKMTRLPFTGICGGNPHIVCHNGSCGGHEHHIYMPVTVTIHVGFPDMPEGFVKAILTNLNGVGQPLDFP